MIMQYKALSIELGVFSDDDAIQGFLHRGLVRIEYWALCIKFKTRLIEYRVFDRVSDVFVENRGLF